MVLVVNHQRLVWLPLRTLRRQVEQLLHCSGYSGWDIGVHFVDNHRIAELNRTYRDKDKPTDILSFPFHEVQVPEADLPNTGLEDDMNLGDMYLSIPYIWQDCRANSESPVERLPILFTHGLCHLMGYDHELDDDYLQMSRREKDILCKFSEMSNKRP
ncbi:hypothetical protein GGI12_002612 [Dipsacomyces acuminosporus]|nr:hypothetical protein GGI12_002612 [Dipsacomyces acuminosporus]